VTSDQRKPDETTAGPRPARVAVHALFKAYGAVKAVDGVSFEIAPGEVFGLLGPNGAGKTTTVETILGLIAPDSGTVSVCGFDVGCQSHAARRLTGAALQSTGLQDGITPREALNAFAALYGARADTGGLLVRFGLEAKAGQRVGTLSGGQKQRLALALAFVNDPQVVILDEPTVGLDPQMRRELHEQIAAMKAEGRSVLLTTHDMDEAARFCDRVAVLAQGRIVAEGKPGELIARSGSMMRVVVGAGSPVEPAWLKPAELFHDLRCDPHQVSFATNDLGRALAVLTAAFARRGVELTGLHAGRGTLEDFILELVGDGA
jgi:ABC-2 type transport system ATP-binding protein